MLLISALARESARVALRHARRGALSRRRAVRFRSIPWSDDLAALLDALGITDKVALAGVAVGGAIALHAAVRLPQRICAAIVGSPATGIAPDRRAAVLARVERIEREGMRMAVEDSMANGDAPELRTDPHALLPSAPAGSATTPQATPPSTGCSIGMDLAPELARIACPVLVLGGALDRVRPPAFAEPVARAIPGAQFRGAGDRPLHGRRHARTSDERHHPVPRRSRRLSATLRHPGAARVRKCASGTRPGIHARIEPGTETQPRPRISGSGGLDPPPSARSLRGPTPARDDEPHSAAVSRITVPGSTARHRCRARWLSRARHLTRAGLPADLPHGLDEQEEAVHAGVAVGQAAAVCVHREAARGRCGRLR